MGFRFVYVQEVEKYFGSKKWRVVIHVAGKCRKLYCTTKGFTAQQKTISCIRKLYCVAEGFIAQQKVLLHSKKVGPVAKIGKKFILRQK